MQAHSLLPIEPESARVATVLDADVPIGAACLLSRQYLLTCRHVVERALLHANVDVKIGGRLRVQLGGVDTQPVCDTTIAALGQGRGAAEDIALLLIDEQCQKHLDIRPVEFASPFAHGGKAFSVLGFPASFPNGLHASGTLRAVDRAGLVQMNVAIPINIRPGFSGAPVWCPSMRAFVGIAVQAESMGETAWLIPSRLLARFHCDLPVRFRIPPEDRPVVHDYDEDDPNAEMFGLVASRGGRTLSATIVEHAKYYDVSVRYSVDAKADRARGKFVSFITYPDFKNNREDAYELYARIENGVAEQGFSAGDLFTVAAVGDAGDTVLTLDLEAEHRRSQARAQRTPVAARKPSARKAAPVGRAKK